MEVSFRICTTADLSDVQALSDELYSSDPNVQEVRPDIGMTLQEFLLRPEKGRLIVFDDGGLVVGYCIIVFFWSNEYSGNLIEVDETCIAATHRSRGIATKLFEWLENQFASDLKGFTLQVANHNESARRLCERLGFSTSRNRHMIKILADKVGSIN